MGDASGGGAAAATGGDELVEVVRAELAKEDDRRRSLEARGLSLASVAGGIVTLATGLAEAGGDSTLAHVHGASRAVLTASMLLFAGAALLAALTNAPSRVSLLDPDGLLELAPELWDRPAGDLRKRLLATQLVSLAAAQRGNDRRGRWLFAATVVLGAAVLALGVALSMVTI